MFSFTGPARHNLCISHKKRIQINKQLNALHKPEISIFIRAKAQVGQLCAAQSMWVWPGLSLLGCSQASKKVKNNCLYTVAAIGNEHIEITSGEGRISLSHEQVANLTRLSYARTYAAIQGTEFQDESLRLWDTSHPRFTRRHLFVAISRARRAELVDVS